MSRKVALVLVLAIVTGLVLGFVLGLFGIFVPAPDNPLVLIPIVVVLVIVLAIWDRRDRRQTVGKRR